MSASLVIAKRNGSKPAYRHNVYLYGVLRGGEVGLSESRLADWMITLLITRTHVRFPMLGRQPDMYASCVLMTPISSWTHGKAWCKISISRNDQEKSESLYLGHRL